MEKERISSKEIESVVPQLTLHDTFCKECERTGTIVKRPDHCIVCKSKNIEIKERKVDATGWSYI